MTANPKVSVCLITYNHKLYIEQAIESVLCQKTNFTWEFIIADDCSTDGTTDIIKEYQIKYPDKIKLITHPANIGPHLNFIELIKSANGTYIAYFEGDDYWIDDCKLSRQFDFLENNPKYSMVFTNRKILKPDGTLTDDSYYTKDVFNTKDIIEGFIPGSQTLMFRNYNSFVPNFLYYNKIYSGDRYLALFCSLTGPIFKLNDVTAVYRITSTGVWNSFHALQKLHKNYNLMKEFHLSLGLPLNNEILAGKAFENSIATLTYCIKRPALFLQKENIGAILSPFGSFFRMNFILFFFKALFNRIFKK